MRSPDLDRERSERRLTLPEFLGAYNEGLPAEFPPVSRELLEAFRKQYPELFRESAAWSLDQHRKRVMDWLPGQMRQHERDSG